MDHPESVLSKGGRPSKIREDEKEVLRQIVEASPLATLEEVTAAFRVRMGLSVHSATVRKGLREAGIERQRAAIVASDPADEPPKRYGYQPHHRDQMPEQRYPSCLTDAEWALVSELFDNSGGRGVPPRYSRRALLDACCYVVRIGCVWRMLPAEFPPWQNVYRTFRRWVTAGKFELMHDRLRAQWREREGRSAQPGATVLDAQLTVAPAVLMPARKSKAASAI